MCRDCVKGCGDDISCSSPPRAPCAHAYPCTHADTCACIQWLQTFLAVSHKPSKLQEVNGRTRIKTNYPVFQSRRLRQSQTSNRKMVVNAHSKCQRLSPQGGKTIFPIPEAGEQLPSAQASPALASVLGGAKWRYSETHPGKHRRHHAARGGGTGVELTRPHSNLGAISRPAFLLLGADSASSPSHPPGSCWGRGEDPQGASPSEEGGRAVAPHAVPSLGGPHRCSKNVLPAVIVLLTIRQPQSSIETNSRRRATRNHDKAKVQTPRQKYSTDTMGLFSSKICSISERATTSSVRRRIARPCGKRPGGH